MSTSINDRLGPGGLESVAILQEDTSGNTVLLGPGGVPFTPPAVFDASDFPALKHFWTADSIGQDSRTLIDVVSGANIVFSSGRMKRVGSSVDITLGGSVGNATVSKSLTTPGTNTVVIFGIFANRGSLGTGIWDDPTGPHAGTGSFELWNDSGTSNSYITDGTNQIDDVGTRTLSKIPLGIGIVCKPGGSAYFFTVDAAGAANNAVTGLSTVSAAALGSIPAFSNQIGGFGNLTNGVYGFYGLAIYVFTTAVTDYAAACARMYTDWINGIKVPYIGWAGKA